MNADQPSNPDRTADRRSARTAGYCHYRCVNGLRLTKTHQGLPLAFGFLSNNHTHICPVLFSLDWLQREGALRETPGSVANLSRGFYS